MSAPTPEPAPPGRKTILIVDDHPVLRRGLVALIESEPDLAVCGTTGDCREALAMVGERRPDLVIVDLDLGVQDGLQVVADIRTRHPDTPSLVLSLYDESLYAERSLRAGARGYVTKQELDQTILSAIRRVLAGGTYMSATLATRLAAKYVSGGTLAGDSPLSALSDRELQVFRLIGRGQTTRQIAEALNLSVKTIESHREHIKQKLGLDSAAELAQRAARWVESGRSD
jgi:DNA-binding NarL/FixJ family response regulator